MGFDNLFHYVGNWGRFQILHFMALCLPSFYMGYHSVSMTFLAPKDQNYRCASSNDTTDQCFSTPATTQSPDTPAVPCRSWEYNDTPYGETLVSEYDLVCQRSWLIQVAYMSYTVSTIISSLVCGWFTDRIGRRLVAITAAWLQLVFAVAEVFAPSFMLFIILRCAMFVLLGFSVTSSYMLMLELTGPRHRTMVGPMYWIPWSFGLMFVPAVAYWVRDYIMLQLILVLPMSLSLLLCFMLEESPRWLAAMGRTEEAENVLTRIAKMNGRKLPLDISVEEEISEDCSVFTANGRLATMGDICCISVLRKELLLLIPAWCTCIFMYYGLSFNTDALPGSIYLTAFLSGVIEIPSNLLAIFLMYKAGRRLTQGWSLLISGLLTIICSLTVEEDDEGFAMTTLAISSKASITIAFTVINLYTTELFPTAVRGQVYMTCSLCSAFAGLVTPFMGKPLSHVWGPLPFLLYGISGLLSGFLVFLLPETLNQPLPETLEDATMLADTNGHVLRYHKLDVDNMMDECLYGVPTEP